MSGILGLVQKFGKFAKQKAIPKTKNIIKGEGRAIKKEYLGVKKGIRNLGKKRTISKTAVKGLATVSKYPYTTSIGTVTGAYFLGNKDKDDN